MLPIYSSITPSIFQPVVFAADFVRLDFLHLRHGACLIGTGYFAFQDGRPGFAADSVGNFSFFFISART